MSRVMALDYGTKAIGVALSDELQMTARPLTTLRRDKLKLVEVLERLAALVVEHEVATLVIGLPLNMDGTRGAAVERVEQFIGKLSRLVNVPVVKLDERLTSRAADEILRAMGMNERERRAKSDEYAALILLRDYLATQAVQTAALENEYE